MTNDQRAGPSHQASWISQPGVAFDVVMTILETLRVNLATTTPALQAKTQHRRLKPRHTDPIEDDTELLEAEAALELGRHMFAAAHHVPCDPDLIALACTQGAYELFSTLMEWANDSYRAVWAHELRHLQLQKAPHTLKSIMVHHISWFQGETKDWIRPVITFAYPLINPPRTQDDLAHNCKLVKKLLPHPFHCLNMDQPDNHQYEHPTLCDCIATAFFWAPDAVGMVYHQMFQPILLPAIAMVLTLMQHCIKEWKTSRFVSHKLNATKQLNVYNVHLKGLLEYIKPAGQ